MDYNKEEEGEEGEEEEEEEEGEEEEEDFQTASPPCKMDRQTDIGAMK